MSDRVAVLDRGTLLQVGTPRALYQEPAKPFVAEFVGEMTFFRGVVAANSGKTCVVHTVAGAIAARPTVGFSALPGDRAMVGVRPEHVRLSAAAGQPAGTRLTGRIAHQIFGGDRITAIVHLDGGGDIRVQLDVGSEAAMLPIGASVTAGWEAARAHAFAEPH